MDLGTEVVKHTPLPKWRNAGQLSERLIFKPVGTIATLCKIDLSEVRVYVWWEHLRLPKENDFQTAKAVVKRKAAVKAKGKGKKK